MRIVLAEDLFLLRDGLIRLLEAYGFEIVAAVDNAPELVRALVDERPDLPPSNDDNRRVLAVLAHSTADPCPSRRIVVLGRAGP